MPPTETLTVTLDDRHVRQAVERFRLAARLVAAVAEAGELRRAVRFLAQRNARNADAAVRYLRELVKARRDRDDLDRRLMLALSFLGPRDFDRYIVRLAEDRLAQDEAGEAVYTGGPPAAESARGVWVGIAR